MKKILFTVICLLLLKNAFAQSKNADFLIKKVGTFPENYVGKEIVLDKIYAWYRLEPSPLDDKGERFYKVTICDTSGDCFSSLGIKTPIIAAVVRKSLAEKLMNDDMSGDEYKYISKITGSVLKKKLGKFGYVLLISKVEIYDEIAKNILDIYK